MSSQGVHDEIKSDMAYQHSLENAKSVHSMIEVKRKRKRLYTLQKAISENENETWEKFVKRKKEISQPIAKIKEFKKQLKKTVDSNNCFTQEKNQLLDSLQQLEELLTPLMVEMQKYSMMHKTFQEFFDNTMEENMELDRLFLKSCQSIFNRDHVPLYADETFLKEIMPSSIYHQRTLIKNKNNAKKRSVNTPKRQYVTMKNKAKMGIPVHYMEETLSLAQKNRTLMGNTAGNTPSAKPQNKIEANAKKLASKERQDLPCSIVEHTPVFVADPDSFSGLAGFVRINHSKASLNKEPKI